jgi:hypothetical protein
MAKSHAPYLPEFCHHYCHQRTTAEGSDGGTRGSRRAAERIEWRRPESNWGPRDYETLALAN